MSTGRCRPTTTSASSFPTWPRPRLELSEQLGVRWGPVLHLDAAELPRRLRA